MQKKSINAFFLIKVIFPIEAIIFEVPVLFRGPLGSCRVKESEKITVSADGAHGAALRISQNLALCNQTGKSS